MKFFIVQVLLFSGPYFYSNTDSLKKRLGETKDSAYINTLVRLADQYIYHGKMDEARKCLEEAGSKNAVLKNRFCTVYIGLKNALYYYRKSEFRLSYELAEELLLSVIETGDKPRIAECKTYLGMNAGRLGDFKKALHYYLEALPLYESASHVPGQMRLYTNIAGVYFDQLDYKMAIDYFKKTLDLARQKDDKKIIGQTFNNIGSAYHNMGMARDAKDYYLKAAEINMNGGNKNNLAYNYMNLASCEMDEGDLKKAREYNDKAMQIFKDFSDSYSIVSCLNVLGKIYLKENNPAKAVQTFEESAKTAGGTKSPLLLEKTYLALSEAYEQAGNFQKALLYTRKHLQIKDSIVTDEIRQELTKKQLYFEFDKKHMADSMQALSKQKYLQQEIDNNHRRATLQRNISLISICSLLVVGGLAFMNYRGLQRNKQANQLIAQKSREILDSFYYAKKIQSALLPSPDMMRSYLPESFILFRPRDIVSGDFYWMHCMSERLPDGRAANVILIAVGDCTGHGVPGAMVSVVCSNALNRAAKEFDLTDPGKILDKARILVIENLSEGNTSLKDGMDISLCKIRFSDSASDSVYVEWAGANNPFWYSAGKLMVEIDANKQSIGYSEKTAPFTTNELQLKKGEMIYLFTDGYADQFGGPLRDKGGKKFKYRPLQDALIGVKHLNPSKQKEELEKIFDDWKGELEQVDDVCIIGIRL